MAFRKKADFILSHKPDILVVPECEHPNKLKFNIDTRKPTDMLWFGENQHKGLGIFSYSDFRFKLRKTHNPKLKMIIPIAVTGGNTILPFMLFGLIILLIRMVNMLNRYGKLFNIIINT